jgi:phage major head subunit gpT-like protein
MLYNSPLAILKGIKANYANLMATPSGGSFKGLYEEVNSNSNEEKYWIPETLPGFKEWSDKRHFGDFGDKVLKVINKDFDGGLSVDRNTIDDSREYLGGNVELWVKGLSRGIQNAPDKFCQAILDANGTAWDNTAFFATSRPNIDTGANTINNLLTPGNFSSSYTITTFTTDYLLALAALLGMKDKNNEPFNEGAKLVALVGQSELNVAQTLFAPNSGLIYNSGTISNIYAGTVEVRVNYRQAVTDHDWYLINENSTFKPFLIQKRKAPEWNVFDDKKEKNVEYGFDFRMGYAGLNPFSIVKVNVA